MAGQGRSARLAGMAVVLAGLPPGAENPSFWQEAVIDMTGPGARACPLAALANPLAAMPEQVLADSYTDDIPVEITRSLAADQNLKVDMAGFERAEEEFASALNFEVTPPVRADATAWRHLAAVASGACQTSRQLLEQSLASTSPYFPREEARKAVAACGSPTASRVR